MGEVLAVVVGLAVPGAALGGGRHGVAQEVAAVALALFVAPIEETRQ